MTKPSEIEIWLADGPYVEEIVERFEKLETELAEAERTIEYREGKIVQLSLEKGVLEDEYEEIDGYLSYERYQVDKLKVELVAHKENEGNECPLCALEAELEFKERFIVDMDNVLNKDMKPSGEFTQVLQVAQLEAENERLKRALWQSHCLQGGLSTDEIELDWENETAVPKEDK